MQVFTPHGEQTVQPTYATLVDDSGAPVTYVGSALPGSSTADAVWQIKKLDETTGLVTTFADGDSNFDNVWDDRASLTYL
ncbi:MAG: hypothetical protein IPP74_14870 [Alphaproteobacteria bacterium]|nr:hypothetical protein [Alphaproteobacteria bacterium]